MRVKQDTVGTIKKKLFLIFRFFDTELLPSTTKDETQGIIYGNSDLNFSNPCFVQDLPAAFKIAHTEYHFVGRNFS